MSKYHQGKFKPINPQKYEGDPTNIIFRSGWEFRMMRWCDQNINIISWSSEEIVIPYVCKTDNKVHRYFVDFLIKVRTKDGKIKTFLVEVKPKAQTVPPVRTKRKNTRYLTEAKTYLKILANGKLPKYTVKKEATSLK